MDLLSVGDEPRLLVDVFLLTLADSGVVSVGERKFIKIDRLDEAVRAHVAKDLFHDDGFGVNVQLGEEASVLLAEDWRLLQVAHERHVSGLVRASLLPVGCFIKADLLWLRLVNLGVYLVLDEDIWVEQVSRVCDQVLLKRLDYS